MGDGTGRADRILGLILWSLRGLCKGVAGTRALAGERGGFCVGRHVEIPLRGRTEGQSAVRGEPSFLLAVNASQPPPLALLRRGQMKPLSHPWCRSILFPVSSPTNRSLWHWVVWQVEEDNARWAPSTVPGGKRSTLLTALCGQRSAPLHSTPGLTSPSPREPSPARAASL